MFAGMSLQEDLSQVMAGYYRGEVDDWLGTAAAAYARCHRETFTDLVRLGAAVEEFEASRAGLRARLVSLGD